MDKMNYSAESWSNACNQIKGVLFGTTHWFTVTREDYQWCLNLDWTEVGHISKCHAVDQAKERAFQGTITELDLAQNASEDNLHFNVGLQLIWPCKPTGRKRVQLCQAMPIKIKISKQWFQRNIPASSADL